eukprot:756973-Hanusia_phi.AAC.4
MGNAVEGEWAERREWKADERCSFLRYFIRVCTAQTILRSPSCLSPVTRCLLSEHPGCTSAE